MPSNGGALLVMVVAGLMMRLKAVHIDGLGNENTKWL